MSFSPSEVAFLRRLVADRPARRYGVIAASIADGHHIGRSVGARVEYGEQDYAAAASALTSRGFELQTPTPGLLRSDAGPGGSEKVGAQRVMAQLVAVVPMNMASPVPAGARFLAARWQELDPSGFDVILECENLEPLLQLARYTWLRNFVRGRRTLAVFRGMPHSFTTGAAAEFIAYAGKPVLGFYDFDPEGLTMAASEPHLEALCLPPTEELAAATIRFKRTHLYLDQVRARRAALDALPPGQVQAAWQLLKSLQCGLNQENFPS